MAVNIDDVKKEVESYQNQNVFGRLSSKQFNQVIESMNLYLNILSQKEAELNKKQEELNKTKNEINRIQFELNEEVSNFYKEKREVEESKKQALETIRIFKEKEPTLRDTSIPDAAVVRDKLIISELDDIRKIVKELKEKEKEIIDKTDYNVELTDTEKDDRIQRTEKRRKQKNILKARLLGIVAAYRDLLPEDQLNFLTINNQSFSAFLKNEIEKIESETPETEKKWDNHYWEDNHKNINRISLDICDSIANGYRSIAYDSNLQVSTNSIYVGGREYSPFNPKVKNNDENSLVFKVVNSIFNGNEKSFYFKGKDAKLTRSIENMSDKPLVEQSIVDTVNEFDYPYYDVEKHNKTL